MAQKQITERPSTFEIDVSIASCFMSDFIKKYSSWIKNNQSKDLFEKVFDEVI